MQQTTQKLHCYHCGEPCSHDRIRTAEKYFCCEGCRLVYDILNENSLCDYYTLNQNPGINQRVKVREGKFVFLDDEKIAASLISFKDEKQIHVTFYLPQMHCSSCLYLLENLHRINTDIISSRVNFTRKEVDLVIQRSASALRKAAETLTSIGYEPYISLNDLEQKRPAINKTLVYQLGVAGFCFGNIMLMSFPEYLGINADEAALRNTFHWLNFLLSLPVFLYSALPFYQSSWKSLRSRFLNIDAPIALAIIITFTRSVYEIFSGTGGGYFDSMTGIVFFMLAGRLLQDKTYRQLSFDRDYSSYFPVAVSVLKNGKEVSTKLPDIKTGDTLLIHTEELIPADGIITRGKALIDYSFVTGESLPVPKEMGELVYAGGLQKDGNIELLAIREVAQSYLTKLWNRDEFKKEKNEHRSFVHLLSRYFTYILLGIALITAIYWQVNNPAKLWPAITSIFIIACPCALLLSNSFTNGNILRILSRNHFYLRDAQTIERIAKINHIVFDKTGTLTIPEQDISYYGIALSNTDQIKVGSLAACSSHPLSRAIAAHLAAGRKLETTAVKETAGKGIEGLAGGSVVKIGSGLFVAGNKDIGQGSKVFISIDNKLYGYFEFSNHYRSNIFSLIGILKNKYRLSVLSGDNDNEKENLQRLSGSASTLLFHQMPEDKLQYIQQLQRKGEKVMMIGDGLNDAGALKQSDTGIAVSAQTNHFTPSSDAIVEAGSLYLLHRFIRLCKANRKIVMASFILSILYNIIGLSFAVQGNLSPLIAAILMPASSLSILLITFGSSNLMARYLRLTSHDKNQHRQ